ncbi:hypothetical protein K9L97_01925 [Candidatus Woesearchaeota archaeon]|nr:hypothetical protein [Candidatus Woesearchaeota archaeon]
MKRGQAALEFLTTYGWAFMVILVMIGALAYFGVLNPQNLIPDQCAITSGFSCRDTLLNTTTISLLVVNNMGETISITGFDASQSTGTIIDTPTLPTGTVNDGNEFTITAPVTAVLTSGSKEKLGFEITYVKSSGEFPHKATGTITQTVQ